MSLVTQSHDDKGWAGSTSPRLLIVGEAWGQHEAERQTPFCGAAGAELTRMLFQVIEPEPEVKEAMRDYSNWWVVRDKWLATHHIALTNVINEQPHNNDFDHFCCSKKELPSDYPPVPSLSRGKVAYLRPEYLGQLSRLRDECARSAPNCIVPVGAVATWAFLGRSDISNVRGTTTVGSASGAAPGVKVLPTYHPSAIIRGQWKWRVIVIADLIKALKESTSAGLVRPARVALVNPTMQEIDEWVKIALSEARRTCPLAVDIETAGSQITCVGFADSPNRGITIPFRDRKGFRSYWLSINEELLAWGYVEDLLKCGRPLVFQNGMYDIQFLSRMGFNLKNAREDTMLLHHSIYPEMQKSLGFMGSLYTNEQSWKLMGHHRATKTKGEKLDQ